MARSGTRMGAERAATIWNHLSVDTGGCVNERTLGKSGYRVSEMGLGCWQLGSDWGAVDEEA